VLCSARRWCAWPSPPDPRLGERSLVVRLASHPARWSTYKSPRPHCHEQLCMPQPGHQRQHHHPPPLCLLMPQRRSKLCLWHIPSTTSTIATQLALPSHLPWISTTWRHAAFESAGTVQMGFGFIRGCGLQDFQHSTTAKSNLYSLWHAVLPSMTPTILREETLLELPNVNEEIFCLKNNMLKRLTRGREAKI
jgi:hypothetical protein